VSADDVREGANLAAGRLVELTELGGRSADGLADVDVGGDASEVAIGGFGDHALRGLAVVVGHVQIPLLEPLAHDVDGDLLDVDGMGGEGVALMPSSA
jgi:hypothetical protein